MNGLGMYGMRYGARPEDFGAVGTEVPAFMQGQIMANDQYAQNQEQQQRMQAQQFALQQAQDAADNQQQFNQLASQAYDTPVDQRNTLLGKMAALNPQEAERQALVYGQMDKATQAQHAAALTTLAQQFTSVAQMAAGPEQTAAYNALLQRARATGKDVSMFENVPPAVGAKMAVAQIADVKGLMTANGMSASGQPRVVGNALVGPNGKVLYQGAAKSPWKLDPSSGTMVNTETGQYRPVTPADAQGAPGLDATVQGTRGNVQFNFPPGTPPEVIAAAQASAVANGDVAHGTQVGAPQAPMTLAQYKAAQKQSGDSGTDLLTDDAKALVAAAAAHGYNIPITNMGFGKAGTESKERMLNSLAASLKNAGLSPDQGISQMMQGATTFSGLRSLANVNAKIMGFEQSAEKEADLALSASSDVSRTGSPVFNAWILAGRQGLAGDPAVSRFNNAVSALAEDYARVIGGGNPSATDSTRELAHKMLNSAMTGPQFQAVVGQMRKEMQARTSGIQGAVQSLRETATANDGRGGGGWPSDPVRSAPTASDIAYLRAHPNKAGQFDAHFGEGSAEQVLSQ